MICIARRLGAPVIEPPGNVAASSAARPTSGAQHAAHRAHQVVHGRQRHQPRQRRDLDAAGAADAPQIVALEIDDHDVFGAVLRRRRQRGGGRRVRCRIGVARARPLDRPGLDARRRRRAPGTARASCPAASPRRPPPRSAPRAAPARARAAPPPARRGASPARIARRRQPARQVHLVGVAGAQVLQDAPRRRPGTRASGVRASSGPSAAGRAGAARTREPRRQPRRRRRVLARRSSPRPPPRAPRPRRGSETRPAARPPAAARRRRAAASRRTPAEIVGQPADAGRDAGAAAPRPPRPTTRAPPPTPAATRVQVRRAVAAHHPHGRGHRSRATHLSRRRRRQPERPGCAAARRAASSGASGAAADRDHVDARDCSQRRRQEVPQVLRRPRYSETPVEMYRMPDPDVRGSRRG